MGRQVRNTFYAFLHICIYANKKRISGPSRPPSVCPHVRFRQPLNHCELNLEEVFLRPWHPAVLILSQNTPFSPLINTKFINTTVFIVPAHEFGSCLPFLFLFTNLIFTVENNVFVFIGSFINPKQIVQTVFYMCLKGFKVKVLSFLQICMSKNIDSIMSLSYSAPFVCMILLFNQRIDLDEI